jgi:hypothetical protein
MLTRKAEPSSSCDGAYISSGARIYAISGRELKAVCGFIRREKKTHRDHHIAHTPSTIWGE